MSIRDSILRNLNISLEDDSPKVEINFNVDQTDDDVVTDTASTPSDQQIESENDATDALEASQDAEKAEGEVQQLQEAQDSLESLKLVLRRHERNGTLNKMDPFMFKTTMESILKKHLPNNNVSVESLSYPKSRFAYVALETVELASEQLEEKVEEAKVSWITKLHKATNKAIEHQDNQIKKAEGLEKIAETTEGEKAANENISVNTERGIQLKVINTVSWETDEQFVEHLEGFVNFIGQFKSESLSEVFNDVSIPTKTIGGELKEKNGVIEFDRQYGSEEEATLVTLKSSTCQTVCQLVTKLLTNDTIGDLLTKYINNSNGEVSKEDQDKLSTLNKLHNLRIKVATEVLNYLNLSLTDREIN